MKIPVLIVVWRGHVVFFPSQVLEVLFSLSSEREIMKTLFVSSFTTVFSRYLFQQTLHRHDTNSYVNLLGVNFPRDLHYYRTCNTGEIACQVPSNMVIIPYYGRNSAFSKIGEIGPLLLWIKATFLFSVKQFWDVFSFYTQTSFPLFPIIAAKIGLFGVFLAFFPLNSIFL